MMVTRPRAPNIWHITGSRLTAGGASMFAQIRRIFGGNKPYPMLGAVAIFAVCSYCIAHERVDNGTEIPKSASTRRANPSVTRVAAHVIGNNTNYNILD